MTQIRSAFAVACAAAVLFSQPLQARGLTAEKINAATWSTKEKSGKLSPLVLKAQVLLDRAGFSPGSIDARGGDNFRKALAAFQASRQLKPSGRLDEATWDKLTAISDEPAVTEYKIRAEDLKGPFVDKIPKDYEEMAELKHLGYRGAREALSEQFHMDEKLLAALNKGVSFDEPDAAIIVANVGKSRQAAKAARLEVNKSEWSVRAYAENDTLLAFFPASVGSGEKPAPSGEFEVRAVARNPSYTYNPEFKFKGQKAIEAVEIAGGPNNPVGAVWIALTAETYGIHGTAEPDKVSKSFSHGCVRLTNWDALALARMVKKGTPVLFKD